MEKEKTLKLNYKRTLIIGFAFFAILMVWQAYNFYCPLFLRTLLKDILVKHNATDYTEFIIGTIMALDNVLALFMLPIFGKLSDNTHTKWGKRMPFIIIGMFLTCLVFPFIALCYLWNSVVGVIVTMFLVLVIMNIYRSPAVALMPDVTPKPLRSSGNGLINLVGYFGPVLISVVNMIPFLKFSQGDNSLVKVLVPVGVVCLSVIIAMIVLIVKINEPKILKEMEPEMALGEELSTTAEKIQDDKPLSKRDKANMWILLVAVCLWFMSFNAFETFNSTYTDDYYSEFKEVEVTEEMFNQSLEDEELTYFIVDGDRHAVAHKYDSSLTYYVKTSYGSSYASMGTIILTVSSIITFAVAGWFAYKWGRKVNVCVGIGLLILGSGLISLLGIGKPSPIIYLYFVFLGIGWALINVNSYPMMVEMSSSKNVGKYTGYYYTASMLAQSFTPILLGAIIAFIPSITLRHLFTYSAIMAIFALVVILFFKENKERKLEYKKGLSSFDQD